jgi:hypothetical protein
VTSREEQDALIGLSHLLASDLSKATRDELIEGIEQTKLLGREATKWSGRLLAALYRTGKSWPEIARLTGLPQTTAYRQAQPYL